jgi:hypothetical protein
VSSPKLRTRVGVSIEVESALIVCAGQPANVTRALARLRSLGEFDLVARRNERLEDQSFNTSDAPKRPGSRCACGT